MSDAIMSLRNSLCFDQPHWLAHCIKKTRITRLHGTGSKPINNRTFSCNLQFMMKLRLSFCGEGLCASDHPKGVYVVATQVYSEVGVKPSVLGQTESIFSTGTTNDVDWTKSFVTDYELGQEINLIVTLRTGNRSISSALFDVGQVLGNVGILGKELKDNNGILVIRIEECKSMGQLQLQTRGC